MIGFLLEPDTTISDALDELPANKYRRLEKRAIGLVSPKLRHSRLSIRLKMFVLLKKSVES